MSSVMIRVGITQAEWQAIRDLSKSSGVPVTRLVADAIRESLLKRSQAANENYSEPRKCEWCGVPFLSRDEYWAHRLEHEATTDALVTRSDAQALDALTRALDRPDTSRSCDRTAHDPASYPGRAS